MFDRCCDSRVTTAYEIIHNPKPLSLSGEMDKIIKNLLWYAPNIDSYQAIKNDLIQDKVYDDFSFTFILNQLGMDEETDVKWIEPNDAFCDDDWSYYENEICCNCQKIIITRQKNLSKTNDLLRCLRNCIAHGHFAIVGDYIIGFNRHSTKNNPDGIKKAIIKLKPQLLLNALQSLTAPMAKELLVRYAFERIGYNVVQQQKSPMYRFDLVIEKNNRRYAIEIKDISGGPYLHPEHLDKFLNCSDEMLPGVERVLFIDSAKVTKEVRKLENRIDNFRIIDLTQVKELLGEPPIDILELNGTV